MTLTNESAATSAPENLVRMVGGEAVTSSLVIAHGTGVQHKNILETLSNNRADFEEFGGVAFETRPFATAGGAQKRTVSLLNEPQATLLMTYLRNTPVVREFKKKLVRAFFALRDQAPAEARSKANESFGTSNLPAIPQTMAEALRLAADECERADTATRELETAKPKVEFYDQCADAEGTFTLTEAAKQLGWRPNVLMERMRDEGILYRQGDKNLPKQYYMDRGWFEVVMRRRNGYITRYPQTRVTPKGMTRIQEKFGKDDMQPYRARTVTKPNTYREVVSAPPKQQGRIAHDVTFGDMLKEFGVSYQEAVRELYSVQAVEYKSGGVYPKQLYEGYFLPEYHGRPVRLSNRIGITPHGVEFLRDIFGCTRVDFSNVRSLF